MVYAIIPARYESTRFPGKPLVQICGKPMVQHVYENTLKAKTVDSVFVATDSIDVKNAVSAFGGTAIMTASNHRSGSDRVAECADVLGLSGNDIVLNVQGDEPLLHPKVIDRTVELFNDPDVMMGTLKKRIDDITEISDSNVVKVVVDVHEDALMFSRLPLPYNRNHSKQVHYFKHIGIYGYRKSFLDKFIRLPKGLLEEAESLEQLRVLENGYKIKVAEVECDCVGVDTPADAERVRLIMQEMTRD